MLFKALLTFLGCALALPGLANEFEPAQRLQIAELIVGQESATAPAPSKPIQGAARQRAKAATYQDERALMVEEEVGILQPRGGAPAEERAYENRNRARANQQAVEGSNTIYAPGTAVLLDPAASSRPAEQRNRARAYSGTGNAQDIDLSNVGRDGIPLVQCHNVDNVSGRIGDDSISGSIVFLVRNGQQIKVRCR